VSFGKSTSILKSSDTFDWCRPIHRREIFRKTSHLFTLRRKFHAPVISCVVLASGILL